MPYASYVLADELHGSGVLAVLTTALFLAEYSLGADDVLTRLAGATVWDVVDTLVTGVAFGLIGLELHNAIRTASGRWGEMLGWAAAIVGVVVVVRLAWLLPATWLTKRLHAKRDYDEEIPTSWRETVIMWWAGMRGVASVALALAIPLTMDDGSAFPDRDEIVFIAFGVIMATLVLQGLTLPWLVKRLGVRADTDSERRSRRSWRCGRLRPRSGGCGRSRTSRNCRRRCPSSCCGGRSTSGCGSLPRWGTGSAGRCTRSG